MQKRLECMTVTWENLPTQNMVASFFAQQFSPPVPTQEPAQSEEVPLVWRAGCKASASPDERRVQTLYIALDHRAVLRWHSRQKPAPDALFLHRPFLLPPQIWPDVAVFAAHKGFDERFTLGYNSLVACLLELARPDTALVREDKGGARVGMVADVLAPAPWNHWREKINDQFGGLEISVRPPVVTNPVTRVAVVGAMTPALIADAAAAGAQAYITGQFREIARSEAIKQGIGVLAVGHRRSEIWGLNQLARELSQAFPTLRCTVIE